MTAGREGEGPVEDALRDAATVDDRLDEVRRARMWGEIERRLDAGGDGPASSTAAASPTRRRLIVGAVVVGALAAAVLAAVGSRALWDRDRVLRSGAPTQIVDVPPGASVRAQLGAAAVMLHGPARMKVERADEVVEVVLERGAVSGDYDGARGGRMRVRTPYALVEVVGTLFDVEVEDAATCVAVAHGEVRVRATREVRIVRGGESWCTDATDVRAVVPVVEARMAAAAAAREDGEGPRASGLGPQEDGEEEGEGPRASGVGPRGEGPRASGVGPREEGPGPRPGAPSAGVGGARRSVSGAGSVSGTDSVSDSASDSASDSVSDSDSDSVSDSDSETVSVSGAVPEDVELYRQAERALQRGDVALADELLARLVVRHARSELVDDALFERARLAYARQAWGAARASLDHLLDLPSSPLRQPARAMLCRIAERTGDRDAKRCFDELRREETP